VVAAKNENIRACLLEKVSFERLGTELDKMFEGNRPMQSVLYLKDFEIL
jgi:tRNA nucleotidyltransferase/poly(A) polymerase